MSKATFARPTSILATLFAAAMFLGGCGGAVESGETDEVFDEEMAETDAEVGESEEALKVINPTGGSSGGGGCGYFCPWWAKDLSDCLMIPCDEYAPSP
jgi:hypothetical protein